MGNTLQLELSGLTTVSTESTTHTHTEASWEVSLTLTTDQHWWWWWKYDDDDEIWSLKVPRWEIDANQISYWKESSGRPEDDLTIHNVCFDTQRITDWLDEKEEDDEEERRWRRSGSRESTVMWTTCGKSIRITSPAHRETVRFLRLPGVLL